MIHNLKITKIDSWLKNNQTIDEMLIQMTLLITW